MAAKKFVALSALHTLISEAFPKARKGDHPFIDVTWLASKLNVTRETIYYWLRQNSLPVQRARDLCKIKGCTKRFSDFSDFLG